MPPNELEKERQRVIELIDARQEFVQDVDGFIYFWPDSKRAPGHMSAHHLRWIADELDRRNKPWVEILQKADL